ncbi:L,D-transpeptidase [Chondromyces crocatus]|uniref:L,D-transpeptidase n=1 Tax=Chondromyces crocatus TaxID=52 RepID=UPI001FE0A13C|nr:L,D-transpeptidase [Chondromyces crocatus]
MNPRDPRATAPAPAPDENVRARSSLVSSAAGFVVASVLAGAVAWGSGCHGEAPPGPSTEKPQRQNALPAPPAPTTSVALPSPSPASSGEPHAAAPESAAPSAAPTSEAVAEAPKEEEEEKPYTGPLLGAQWIQTPVYPTMEFSNKRVGYIRRGGKVPVDPKPLKGGNCAKGWYRLLDGGYVCGKYSTLDMSDPQVRLGVTPPNLDDLLPYKYAYNNAHGTPLYRSVPSREEMNRYEPYLEAARKKKKEQAEKKKAELAKKEAEKKASDSEGVGGSSASATGKDAVVAVAIASAGVSEGSGGDSATPRKPEKDKDAPLPTGALPSGDGPGSAGTPSSGVDDKTAAAAAAASLGLGLAEPPPETEDDKPWWQRTYDKDKPLSITLADLDKDADGPVAKRMVKGFFVAIDKSFGWNDRLWYKTTSGLVAPSDRMYVIKPPGSQGSDFPEGARQVGFILSTKASKYEVDAEAGKVKVTGSIARQAAFGLTGESVTVKTVLYRKTTDGWWMRDKDGTYAEPGTKPSDLATGEKWVDVNLTRKTLTLVEGDKPVFAALISPGKRSSNKKKDHPTKPGVFRIREKHIAAVMDGDGTAAGDLPYSIEDVPFVAYYDGSYALHGAFWHSDFGRERSHGCVNLAPLDAKRVFMWTEPRMPRGWHGVWSTPQKPGTLISIHD